MTGNGTAWGAALVVASEGPAFSPQPLYHAFLGPGHGPNEIERALEKAGLRYTRVGLKSQDAAHPERLLAERLRDGAVIGIYQGPMEFGPRALGNRSILSQATDPEINRKLNERLRRTEFMPFAPISRIEDAPRFENLAGFAHSAEFMTITCQCTAEMVKSTPSVVHVDGTARPQFVNRETHPLLHRILTEYKRQTGLASLINTSFNVHEEPVVCTPGDAIQGFVNAGLDLLYFEGGYLVALSDNISAAREALRRAWLSPSQKEQQLESVARVLAQRAADLTRELEARGRVIEDLAQTAAERLEALEKTHRAVIEQASANGASAEKLEEPPLVTIITPSYNQGRFIRATIESVLSQDYPRIEYIIMDGGSTDETADVVKEYAGRLTWISEKDRGQSHAINKGFRAAKGEIVAWLNSDDTYLPGAVSNAVRTLTGQPRLGAVYGEGYQVDVDGKVKQRFPVTEPFNLWKLIYLSDYILQQTLFFRKSALDAVGDLDENLNWSMDWDILIRLGKQFHLGYIPEYMGCLREYAEAKSISGGRKRFRELAWLLRHHTRRRYPPGYVTYGLDTYIPIWCNWVQRMTPRFLARPSTWFQAKLRGVMLYVLDRTIREAQGWYSDGWVTTTARFMLPPGNGRLRLRGKLPNIGKRLAGQVIRIECNGAAQKVRIPLGEFDVGIRTLSGELLNITLRAKRSVVPLQAGLGTDSRKLAFILKSIEWEE